MSFVPGMFPAGASALGKVLLTEIVQQASATSSGANINAPADIIAGDAIILLDRAFQSGSTPGLVIPSGFTQIDTRTLEDGSLRWRQTLSYKLANGSEANASIAGMNQSNMAKILVTFRGNARAKTLTIASVNGQATSGNPGPQTVTASGGTPPLVVLGAYGGKDPVTSKSMSPTEDDDIVINVGGDGQVNCALAWKIYNASPANVSVDMGDAETGNILQSFYMEMA